MPNNIVSCSGTVALALKYRDVEAARDWLRDAFGFEEQLVVRGSSGRVSYAQLSFGDGIVMLAPLEPSDAAWFASRSLEAGALGQSYIFVPDVRAHCRRAQAAGAEIVMDADDAASQGKGYSCRDPEGHVWTFGTFDPRRCQAVFREEERKSPRGRAGMKQLVTALATICNLVLAVAAVAVAYQRPVIESAQAAAMDLDARSGDFSRIDAERQLAQERAARRIAERALNEVRAVLQSERTTRAQAGAAEVQHWRSVAAAGEQAIARAALAFETAERSVAQTQQQLQAAQRERNSAREEAVRERAAREAAERKLAEAGQQLEKQRAAPERAPAAAAQQQANQRARSRPPVRYRLREGPSGSQFAPWE